MAVHKYTLNKMKRGVLDRTEGLQKMIKGKRSCFGLLSLIAGVAMAVSTAVAPAAAQSSGDGARINFGGEGARSRSIVLPLNKAAIVELPQNASDVLVSQPTVVDAVVRSPRRVYLLGLTIGQTNAFFFDAQGREILNLEIRVESDLDALTDLLARLMPNSRITAEAVNDNIILRGSVRSSVEAANAADIAGRFIGNPDNVLPMLSITQREQVMVKVRVVEMQRSIMKQLGVDLSGDGSFSNTIIDSTSTTIGSGATASGLGFALTRFFGGNPDTSAGVNVQALENIGVVKTLAEPTLTAISGESANFLAGGEFPIPVAQDDGVTSIEFRQFGVGLGFTPLVLDKGRISLKLSTEVSEITTTNNFTVSGSQVVIPGTPQPDGSVSPPTILTTGGLTIPSFTVRRAETTVELPSGGSLVMAGLLQENMRQSVNGLPALKDLPVLGQLFRSRDYENAETELVIMVTPYLVDPVHESELTDPAKGFAVASDFEAILLGRLTAAYGLSGAGVQEKTLQGPLGFVLD